MLNAWGCLSDVLLCRRAIKKQRKKKGILWDEKTREFSKNQRQLVNCAVGRGAKWNSVASQRKVFAFWWRQ
jgi:hypothetical protein